MDTERKEPVGAALFTRQIEQGADYNWGYAQTGTLQLLDEAKKVFATVLGADSIITDRIIFAVIQQDQRIGIVVAHIPTSRRDFSGRPISATLYLEFNSSDKADILHNAATLLNSSYQENRFFLDYAEDLLRNPHGSPKPIQLPSSTTAKLPQPVVRKKGLTFSPLDERDQYANHLTRLPDNFCFVSTGHVNQSQYQELGSIFKGGLLVLTSNKSAAASTGEETSCSWHLPYRWSVKKPAVGLAAVVLVLLSAVGLKSYKNKELEGAKTNSATLTDQNQKLQKNLTQERKRTEKLTTEIRTKEETIEQLKKENDVLKKRKTGFSSSLGSLAFSSDGHESNPPEEFVSSRKEDKAVKNLTTVEVKALQTKLKEVGYYKYDVDGDLGSKTYDAISEYQRNKGIPAFCNLISQIQQRNAMDK